MFVSNVYSFKEHSKVIWNWLRLIGCKWRKHSQFVEYVFGQQIDNKKKILKQLPRPRSLLLSWCNRSVLVWYVHHFLSSSSSVNTLWFHFHGIETIHYKFSWIFNFICSHWKFRFLITKSKSKSKEIQLSVSWHWNYLLFIFY